MGTTGPGTSGRLRDTATRATSPPSTEPTSTEPTSTQPTNPQTTTAAVTVAIVVGGGPVRPATEAHDAVIAADSGLDEALAAGFVPTHLVGDLDSISPAGLAWVDAHGIAVDRHPADKDHTDTALAIALACRLGATVIVLHGSTGVARLDHLLGTLGALGDDSLGRLDAVRAHLDDSTVHVLHAGRSVDLDLAPGAVFSLVALHGDCRGVDVVGARWPLRDAHLTPGTTRGISNVSTGDPVHVGVVDGVLTVVVPATPPGDHPDDTPAEQDPS